MSIDDLYERVTEEILRAEDLEDHGPAAEILRAYSRVSYIEEEIADATPPSGPEGAIARRGAVRAALKAGTPMRALELAERYLAEPAPQTLATELLRMKADANAALELPDLRTFRSASYRVLDAAA